MGALSSSSNKHPMLARVLRPVLILTLLAAGIIQFSPKGEAQLRPALPQTISAFNIIPHQETGGSPGVEGWVKNDAGEAIAGATVLLNSRIETHSDKGGYFSFSAEEARMGGMASKGNTTVVQLGVRSAGYSDWTINNAVYYPGDALRIHPKLEIAGKKSVDLTSVNGLAGGKPVSQAVSMYAAKTSDSALTPPATIRVYRARTGVVEAVPFKDYIKHSLPSEWVPSWSSEALKAGAIAVKSYAWYWISKGGKQAALGADVKDNVDDQVYDPNVSYASTDAAVDATFQYAITMNGSLFQTQYCAGTYDSDPSGDCPWSGQYMTQWGSSYYGDQGKSWAWILQFYYPGSVITPSPPGGYKGPPPPTATEVAAPKTAPTTSPPYSPPAGGGNYTIGVGQGTNPEAFQEAYMRNGGLQGLGKATGPVRWWLQYVTEFNLLAQPFSGPDGRGKVWIVYDTLKANVEPGLKASVLSGDIALFYANHTPPGSEWLGAPTSDPYVDASGQPSQSFVRGLLVGGGQQIEYVPWPQQFAGWRAEYFVGRADDSSPPALALPGRPAQVRDVPFVNMDWPVGAQTASRMGLGKQDWSAQFTRQFDLGVGTYNLTLSTGSGARVWLDGALVINGWQWNSLHTETFSADLGAGSHAVRVQYYSPSSAAKLSFDIAPKSSPTVVAAAATATIGPPRPPSTPVPGTAALRARVKWLGRASAPDDSWVQPVTLFLSSPSNPNSLKIFRGTTDRTGMAAFQGLPAGIYNVHIKGPHSIQSARANITLMGNAAVDLDMNAQIEGDIDGDNCVTVDDFQIVQAMLGANRDTPGFNSAADLNGDGKVTMTDVSLLRSGFDMCGDISADNAFRTLSENGAPELGQMLEPWLNPGGMQHDLSLGFAPSTTTARPGQIVEMDVVADAGAQPIDGASFVARFDPKRLQPVDGAGNVASSVEPGVALPAVMGNWVDAKGGGIGYAAGVLQGRAASGQIVIAHLRFLVVGSGGGQTQVSFDAAPSSLVQLTNGGANLLAKASSVTLYIQP